MPESHLLDTSVLSQPIKDKPLLHVLRRWSVLEETAICTSVVCLAELLQGLEQRQSDKYWRSYRELVENRYRVLALDEPVAKTFGKIAGEPRRLGQPRPVVDTLIAATARHHGLIVATLHARHLRGIPGVGVEDWFQT